MHVLASIWEGRTNCVVFICAQEIPLLYARSRIEESGISLVQSPLTLILDFLSLIFLVLDGKPGHEDEHEHEQQLSVNKIKEGGGG